MNIRETYNYLARNYDLRQTNPFTRILRKKEARLVKKFASGKVLDLGCGTGEHLTSGFIGLDTSNGILKLAKARSSLLVQGNMEILPIKTASIDTIICFYGTLNLADFEKSISEMFRILKPSGKAILSVISAMDGKGEKFKKFRLEKKTLKMRLFEWEEIIEAFKGHKFNYLYRSSVFRMQRPRWGNFQQPSRQEKIKLKLEKLAPRKLGRVYLVVFEKQ